MAGEFIRVHGLVQGVGFRPMVWHLAHELGLTGEVFNDSAGVVIQVWGEPQQLNQFCQKLLSEQPPLARIDAIERKPNSNTAAPSGFVISSSIVGKISTGIVADAATCSHCLQELFDPNDRRYGYPFINCTHCGPRLSIVRAIPYDRCNTSMTAFTLCSSCSAEYHNPADRRYHAQPNACALCGPTLRLETVSEQCTEILSGIDGHALRQAEALLRAGCILAVKGIGGFHLVCDASHAVAVATLRKRKRRYAKPFALMARDIDVIRNYCAVSEQEIELLRSAAAPIVLLELERPGQLAPAIAPGQTTLGFMLPYTPLHHLLLAPWEQPLVMTSGNRSDQPQCTDNTSARNQLSGLVDALLLHDREILNRVDDSVSQIVAGVPRLLRRARGYAPTIIPLPPGLSDVPDLLALGGELKNTFCLLQNGQAIVSQHLGDLQDATTAMDYRRNLDLYSELFQHQPMLRAADQHPGYLSTQLAHELAAKDGLPVIEIQHHHAHIAACLAENSWPRDAGAVLGVALDGLGYGDDGSFWGGEFLRVDYGTYRRLGRLAPVPLLGGTKAILEPWRSTYAQLSTLLDWADIEYSYSRLELLHYLKKKPLHTLDTMLRKNLNTPLTSSCGRLFDAVAAAIGICREGIRYEGQAAIELTALAAPIVSDDVYPFSVRQTGELLELNSAPMWQALLEDLRLGTPHAIIAARFQHSLAGATAALAGQLARAQNIDTIALSGGVFQNAKLLLEVHNQLQAQGFNVLSHKTLPTNDGGLALGQAVVAAYQASERKHGAHFYELTGHGF